ncbi:hypothetical protein [Flavobacterium pectinovorum]|jgi:hypothetical protein|uniref:Tetratricopeptide repeat protein n=1 Tax=Flavobacterium pectinovorum TaxID=29533 RepID=A0A502F0W0_9FLAO|nr:hypothetical protein [Flavobacterium pectinovorum]TPG42071.1 hypothetical protein EAH81_07045 [Flavobacterium pectinovorum]
MRNALFFIVLLITFKTSAQNNSKITFQKNRYELAVSYYKKADFINAIDLFYMACKLIPDNEIGIESSKKVDVLRTILRDNIMVQALGTWKSVGDKPGWAIYKKEKVFDEFIEVTNMQILFYKKDKITQEQKLTNTEDLVYYNGEDSDPSFSNIILSNGTIWHCAINNNSSELHVINIAKKDENGIDKIQNNNAEEFYVKVK